MTISVTHPFVSAKSDGTDATLVQPSNWNASHTMTMATAKVLGRATAGTGAVEELSAPAFGQSILAASDLNALVAAISAGLFTTGDAKLTLKTSADSGWVMMDDGTIGDASSSASTRANADTSALFTLIWNNVSNTYAPIFDSGGIASSRGVSAAADFSAHKRLALTKQLGRALAIGGAGSGLTTRTLGQTLGEETHALITAELPSHSHSVTDPGHIHGVSDPGHNHGVTDPGHAHNVTDPGHSHNPTYNNIAGLAGGGGQTFATGGSASTNVNLSIDSASTGISIQGAGTGVSVNSAGTGISVSSHSTGITIQNTGSGTAHNVMQPTVFWNVMVKL